MKVKRRLLSIVLALSMVSAALTGCGQDNTTTPSGDTGTSSKPTTAVGTKSTPTPAIKNLEKEAPMLAAQVAKGELPKLEDRIPKASDVMVEPDVISLGQYGGSVRITSNDGGRWSWGPYTEQGMFRFKQDGSGEVEANVCKNFYSNADASVWTIELREGMKWSDGEPFTADDVIFYYDHCSVPALNADRTAVAVDSPDYYNCFTTKPYNCYQVAKDGKKYWAKFDKVDDYKFTVTFAAPKPSFAQEVAVDNKWMFLPKHFYKDFVARKDGVSDDPTFPLITEEQALENANKAFGKAWTSYKTMGKDIGYYNWDYAIVPQLRSFIAVKDNWNKVGETYTLVRNPYFWKVDSEGRQLPYLDSIEVLIINESEQAVLKATAGEIDLFSPASADFVTVAMATKDTHKIYNWTSADWGSQYTIALNQTAKDLDKRKLFQDKTFREALSIGVDRTVMSATLSNSEAEPYQCAVSEGNFGYSETWAKKWTEYGPGRANELLDKLTEPWDRKEGTYRKMKGTNKDLEIVITLADASQYGDFISLITTYYKKLGIKISTKVDAEESKAKLNNDVECSIERPSVSSPAIRPDDIVPMRNFKCWTGLYGKWYEDGKSEKNGGIAPTGDMLELINAYEAIRNAVGPDRNEIINENVKKIYKLHEENIWIIGFLSASPSRWIVNNKVKNFPKTAMSVDEFRFASMMRPEQLYISEQ